MIVVLEPWKIIVSNSMAAQDDGWDEEEEWEDENEQDEDSGDEHWSEDDEEYAARQRNVAQRREAEASVRPESREERYARRYTEAPSSSSASSSDTQPSSSAASSSASSASSTPLSAAERMRRATEERERGRAAAIAEREHRERETDAPNPLITKFEAIDKAKRNAPGIKLTSPEIYEGRKFSNRLNEITKQFGNNPNVVFEMETVAENYKIITLAINYLDREMDLLKVKQKMTKEEKRAWINMAEWIHQLQGERRYLKDSLDDMVRRNRKQWNQPFVPVPITVPDIEKDCLGETESGISKALLVQGKCVKLSDGRCYNFDDIINFYKKTPDKLNLISPYTRQPFKKADIDIILTLIQQGHSGGKRTNLTKRKKPKTKKIKPKKMRKTRVR